MDPLVPWGTRCQEPRGVRNQRGSSHPLCSLALPRADREGWGPYKIQRVGPLANPTAPYPLLKRKARSEGASRRPRHLGMRVRKGILVIRRWRHSHMPIYRRPR